MHAMTDMGFTAHNAGGSAVEFRNERFEFDFAHDGRRTGTGAGAGGKIVFHKPHPVAKIDTVMLRSMGKRMARWFGWGRSRFVLQV